MSEYNGKIIEYLRKNNYTYGLVTGSKGKKLIVLEQHGKEQAINISQIVCLHSIQSSRSNLASDIKELDNKIEETKNEIDTNLIWEIFNFSKGTSTLTEFCQAYFESTESFQLSAMFRALLDDPKHFKNRGGEFSVFSQKQLDENLLKEKKTRQKELFKIQLGRITNAFDNKEEIDAEAEDNKYIFDEAEEFLFKNKKNNFEKFIGSFSKLPPREIAFDLLKKVHKIPEGMNKLFTIAGIETEFSPEVLETAAQIPAFTIDANREDITDLTIFSIDDDDTLEIDDAISLQEKDGNFIIGIHIADPEYFVENGDLLDITAKKRTSSIYLPTGAVTMFPEKLSCDLASLNPNKIRPALSLFIDMTHAGQINSWHFSKTAIKSKKRLNYEEADDLINSTNPTNDIAKTLQVLTGVSLKLQAKRLNNGGFEIDQPELKVRVINGKIKVKEIFSSSPSRRIIQEMMIIFNSLAAEFADKNSIPAIYRLQPPPTSDNFPIGTVIKFDPIKTPSLFKHLKGAKLSLMPGKHSGLGCLRYMQMSSPLRRYGDFIMHRQFSGALAKSTPPHNEDDLYRIIAVAESTAKEIKGIENNLERQWVIKFVEDNYPTGQEIEATILYRKYDRYQVLLNDIPIKGFLTGKNIGELGDKIIITLKTSDPENNILNFEFKRKL